MKNKQLIYLLATFYTVIKTHPGTSFSIPVKSVVKSLKLYIGENSTFSRNTKAKKLLAPLFYPPFVLI